MAFVAGDIEVISELASAIDTDITLDLSNFTTAVASGDLLIAVGHNGNGNQAATFTDNGSKTWNAFLDDPKDTARGTDIRSIRKYTVANGAWTHTVTYAYAGQSGGRLSFAIVKISNVDTTNFTGDNPTGIVGSWSFTDERNVGGNPNVGSFTVEDDALAFCLWHWAGVSTASKTWGQPSGYTGIVELSGTAEWENHLGMAYKIISTGTSEDPAAGTNTGWAAGAEGHYYGFSIPFGGSTGQTISPALTQQLAAATAPTVTPGGISLSPGLAQQLAAAYDPALAMTIAPALTQQLAAAYDPAQLSRAIVMALVQQTATAYDPSVSLDTAKQIDPELAQQLASALDPTVTPGGVTISPALAQQLATGLAPQLDMTIAADLVQQLATAYDPQLDMTIAAVLVQQLVTAYAPIVSLDTGQQVDPGLAQQLTTTYDPSVTPGAVSLSPGLAQQLATALAPSVGLSISPGLAQQLTTAYDPQLDMAIALDLVQQLVTAYDPAVTGDSQIISPALVQQLVTAYGPTVGIVLTAVVSALISARDARPDTSRGGRPTTGKTARPTISRSTRVR